MEPVCYVCQEYENNIGHITRFCPNKQCKICGQKGHFGFECENIIITRLCPNKQCRICGKKGHFGFECKDIVSRKENCKKIATKKENCSSTTVKEETDKIKTENHVSDEFSKSEESAVMYSINCQARR